MLTSLISNLQGPHPTGAFGRRAIATALAAVLAASATARAAEPTPVNELAYRQALATQRLLHGAEPTFTPDFILADIRSTQTIGVRRFDEFHGDLSGRYLSAVAHLPAGERPQNLAALLDQVVALQQPDGRFGRMALEFTPEQVGRQHMALLWGNGRLLVGLVDAWHAAPSDAVKQSAIKLGDFLLRTIQVCSRPEMQARLVDQKAYGYICFTQLTEGLVMLSDLTGDARYLDAARQIYPKLPPRGQQHSHGYLATLRGVMLAWEAAHHPEDLAFVEGCYADLTSSKDTTPMGSVNEYFGAPADHGGILRDEGCSHADFLELSLQLWRATHRPQYLERAELCLANGFTFNQFATGDWGHHVLNGEAGIRGDDQEHRAWWCCTMHGLRWLMDARASVIREETGTTGTQLWVDLFYPATHAATVGAELRQPESAALRFELRVTSAPANGLAALSLRQPHWGAVEVTSAPAGRQFMADAQGYLTAEGPWQPGDVIEFTLNPRLRLTDRAGHTTDLNDLTTRTQGYLYYGPNLMAASPAWAPGFTAEPMEGNLLHAKTWKPAPAPAGPGSRPAWGVEFDYTHDGFPGTWKVHLQPVSDQTFTPQGPLRTLFTLEP